MTTPETRCLHCGGDVEPDAPVPLCRRDIVAVHDYWRDREDLAAHILRGEPTAESQRLLNATRARPRTEDGVVYYVRLGDRVKIGWTSNLRNRLEQLPHEQGPRRRTGHTSP